MSGTASRILRFAALADWRRACVDRLAVALAQAAARGPATLAVPGGRTAALLLPELARRPLNWGGVTVAPIDERWVPLDHPDSNEGLIRRTLAETGATIVGLKTVHERPEAALETLDRRLAELPPTAVALVGMGEDGHIASLFPGAPPLAVGAAVEAAARPDHLRVSWRLERIAAAGQIILALAGAAKWSALQQTLPPAAADSPAGRLIERAGGRLTALVQIDDGR